MFPQPLLPPWTTMVSRILVECCLPLPPFQVHHIKDSRKSISLDQDTRGFMLAEIADLVLCAATPKPSHPLDDDEHESASPRASKKRRLESEGEEPPIPAPLPNGLPHDTAGDNIEEELASALGTGMVDATDRPAEMGPNQSENSAESAVAPETGTDLDPDMATVISSIMNHAERVEEQCAVGEQQLGEDTSNQEAPKGLVFVKANSHLKIQSLPILDNLVRMKAFFFFFFEAVFYHIHAYRVQCMQSTQILSLLAKSTYQDITSFVSEPESENGQAYATMRSLFDHTKKVYSTKKSFLSPIELELTEPSQVDIIRKANLASFVSSIFGTQEIGFSELNDNFIDVFVPEGGRLLKVQGALFLELKTQAFIASMNNTERSRTEILFDLFPDNLEQCLIERHTGSRQLAPSEVDFVKRAASRRDILLADINNQEALKSLPDKYHWEDFLRDLSSYITKNFDSISHQQVRVICFFLSLYSQLIKYRQRRQLKEDSYRRLVEMRRRLLPVRLSKVSFLFLNNLRMSPSTRICMATSSLVPLVPPKSHCRAMG